MNLSQLYYFKKLAELQHYTRAAKELYIAQPTLSDAISSLEKELGVALFCRDGRSVKPVSYTHLDVYKRQVYQDVDARLDPAARINIQAQLEYLAQSGKLPS